ncbi:hypothetical protein H2248_005342 [Termitomyces sp. 'cryptogamus']|nr:hypothetical protein H2248_005342 [Termitomyces sp. 'cryptogamus']
MGLLISVAQDLALQREGTFILRYRIFDISSLAVPGMKSTAQTEVYGGPFKVYATKDFPGLAPSTELSKLLSRYSIRLTVRQERRISRKRRIAEREEENQSSGLGYDGSINAQF